MKTTVIVLNYNGEKYIKPLMNRLKGEECKVLVVDNNSKDNSRKMFNNTRTGPNIKWVQLNDNLGFAMGNNYGAMHARTDNVLFLNNDTLPKQGFVTRMENCLTDEIGIVGAKLVYGETKEMDVKYDEGSFTWKTKKDKLQHAGIAYHSGGSPYEMGRDMKADAEIHNIGKLVDSVTGACMLIKRSTFNDLAGFDPIFVNGWEDTDLCLRARENGVKCWYEPVPIIHYCSASKGRFDKETQNKEIWMDRWVKTKRIKKILDV